MSETIADIVGDIRSRNQGCPLDAEGSHPLAEDMLALADRIEQAVTNCNQPEPVTNCNSLNAAKSFFALFSRKQNSINLSKSSYNYSSPHKTYFVNVCLHLSEFI